MYNTCVILVFLFFPPTIQNSIYTFLKPDKIRSIFPLGRMDKNHFICGQIVYCCQTHTKAWSSHMKIFSYSMISIKQATALNCQCLQRAGSPAKFLFSHIYIAHKNFNFVYIICSFNKKGDKCYRKLTEMVCNRHI